jgi:DNA-binding NtrC family response regulator
MQTVQEQLLETIDYFPTLCLSQYLKKIYQQAKKISSRGNSPILITGEKGTGKEFLAKNIHYISSSLQQPFFIMNCSHLAFDNFEKKLEQYLSALPHTPDAQSWSGSSPLKKGGTIFLRDVGKLDNHIQGKVFDVLKETCGRALRSSATANPAIHLIFSFCRNGDKAADNIPCTESLQKVFHPDTLDLMPLRERLEDIQPLASFFLDRFSKEYGKDIGGIHSEALSLLKSYDWPCNVSELKNVMENAVLLAQGPLITRDDIRFNISKKSITLESFFSREDYFALEEIERIYIQTVLRRVKNNKSKASKILGITRNTLQNRLDSFAKPAARAKARKKSQQQTLPFPG